MNRQLSVLAFVTITGSLAIWPCQLRAGPIDEARVTRVKNHVKLENSKNVAHGASINDIVHEETIVRTGNESRAELTFSDETVVRLAAHTAFDFDRGTHGLNLRDGAVLVQAPKGARGATIHAGGVAASVAGTTVMIEYHPGVYKFLVLEGTGRLYRPGHVGDSVLVAPGQLVFGNPEAAVSDPVDVDIARFMKTSRFITDFPPLRSEKSIVAQGQKQQREKSNKTLRDTNLVIFGGGTQVSDIGQGRIDLEPRTGAAFAAPRRVSTLNRNTAPALP